MMMTPDELKALGKDIKAHDMRVPITIFTTRASDKDPWQLLDGRNRLMEDERQGIDSRARSLTIH